MGQCGRDKECILLQSVNESSADFDRNGMSRLELLVIFDARALMPRRSATVDPIGVFELRAGRV